MYYNMDGEPIDDIQAMLLFRNFNDRIVAQTYIGEGLDEVHVSTVLLVINHQFGNGPPLIFETMVFGGNLDQDQYRYSTLEEAKEGHARAVLLVTKDREFANDLP